MVHRLVNRRGFGVNKIVNSMKYSALHYACGARNLPAVKVLLRQPGININLKTQDGWSPLLLAVRAFKKYGARDGSGAVRELLSQPGLLVNPTQINGWTPLMSACVDCSELGIISDLLSHEEIDIDARDTAGFHSLRIACHHDRTSVVELLIHSPLISNGHIADGLEQALLMGHLRTASAIKRHLGVTTRMNRNPRKASKVSRSRLT